MTNQSELIPVDNSINDKAFTSLDNIWLSRQELAQDPAIISPSREEKGPENLVLYPGQDPGRVLGKARPDCGKKVIRLKCKCCGAVCFRVYKCGHRLCQDCAKQKSRELFFELKEIIKRTKVPFGMRYKLITLTIRHKEFKEAVNQAVKGLSKFFHNVLEPNGIGAFAHLELSPKGVVHWHILYLGKYLPQAQLSREWARITGDSPIVDIRAVTGEKGLFEVCKYIVKFTAINNVNKLWAYYYQIKNKRVLRTFGIFYNRLRKSQGEKPCPICQGTDWLYLDMVPLTDWHLEQISTDKRVNDYAESG